MKSTDEEKCFRIKFPIWNLQVRLFPVQISRERLGISKKLMKKKCTIWLPNKNVFQQTQLYHLGIKTVLIDFWYFFLYILHYLKGFYLCPKCNVYKKFSVSLAAQASLHYFKIHGNGLLRAKGRYPRHGTLFNVPFDRHKNYQYVWQIFCSRFTPVKRLIFCCKNHILAKIGNKSSSNNVIRSCILEKKYVV